MSVVRILCEREFKPGCLCIENDDRLMLRDIGCSATTSLTERSPNAPNRHLGDRKTTDRKMSRCRAARNAWPIEGP
jgi:hypothetical protein